MSSTKDLRMHGKIRKETQSQLGFDVTSKVHFGEICIILLPQKKCSSVCPFCVNFSPRIYVGISRKIHSPIFECIFAVQILQLLDVMLMQVLMTVA